MKVPRDISGRDLARLLGREFGYSVTRQRGSHLRVTTEREGTHHVTLPDHDPIRIGTLSAILNEVAQHFNVPRRDLEEKLSVNGGRAILLFQGVDVCEAVESAALRTTAA